MSDLAELTKVSRQDDLAELKPMDAALGADYWSPEPGEVRRFVYLGITDELVPDFNDRNKSVPLRCVVFGLKSGRGWRRICNGSKRLVAVFESNDVPVNTAYEITYHGMEKNRTNQNQSGRWSVVPLVRKEGG